MCRFVRIVDFVFYERVLSPIVLALVLAPRVDAGSVCLGAGGGGGWRGATVSARD